IGSPGPHTAGTPARLGRHVGERTLDTGFGLGVASLGVSLRGHSGLNASHCGLGAPLPAVASLSTDVVNASPRTFPAFSTILHRMLTTRCRAVDDTAGCAWTTRTRP